MERIKNVPLGLFVGLEDVYGDKADVLTFKNKLSTLKFYKEYANMDHFSFGIGKNMAYTNDVITLLKNTGNMPAAT